VGTVLVTGFGAYGDEAENPSQVIATRLDQQRFDDVTIVGRVLPVGAKRVRHALCNAIEQARPDVIVITGVAPGRTSPALERVAINVLDFPIPDVDGYTPVDEPVEPQGPSAYISTLPIKAIADRWHREGIPGYISNTAGTYVCNQTFFLARHFTHEASTRAGLLHIPSQPRRAQAMGSAPPSSMSLDLIEQAVRSAISTAVTHQGPDLRIAGGAAS
jgi:pyroglutamyl-peptidase